jgi:hypothetical protein
MACGINRTLIPHGSHGQILRTRLIRSLPTTNSTLRSPHYLISLTKPYVSHPCIYISNRDIRLVKGG